MWNSQAKTTQVHFCTYMIYFVLTKINKSYVCKTIIVFIQRPPQEGAMRWALLRIHKAISEHRDTEKSGNSVADSISTAPIPHSSAPCGLRTPSELPQVVLLTMEWNGRHSKSLNSSGLRSPFWNQTKTTTRRQNEMITAWNSQVWDWHVCHFTLW